MELPRLVITDIDGVWTDGGMYYSADGDVMKLFCVKDGWGVIMLRTLGIPTVIMTGENTPIVSQRAKKLGIDQCYIGVSNKLALARQLCDQLGISLSQVAAIGDDINDVPLLRAVGYSASPDNTPDYIKREVDFVCKTEGGHGAFREFAEHLLKEAEVFDQTIDTLISNS